jgi:hypothetical protein
MASAKSHFKFLGFSLLVLIGALLTGCHRDQVTAAAQPGPSQPLDPPGRVARLSYLEGAVSFKAAGAEDWVAAEQNRPLTAGDELWTDEAARAELSTGSAAIRLDARTGIGVLNLDDHTLQIKLTEGSMQVRLRRLDEDDALEIDTPKGAVSLLRAGEYRVEVDPGNGDGRVIVRSGSAEVTAPSRAFEVRPQQQARFTGTETLTYEITPAQPLDSFDTFCQNRDRRADQAEALKYVSPYTIGWEDLDEFGYWRTYPDYGWVWIPRAPVPGWAPYRFGHWVWIYPWGWTWIDDAPWGFAPHHYGRWVFLDTSWCWIPGPIAIRAIYAPALVVFIGGGGYRYHFQVGLGVGVAWFPLGPREIYVPPYRATRGYVTNINVSHTSVQRTTNIYATDLTRQPYRNRAIPGAVTAVPEGAFVGGQRTSRFAATVRPEEAAGARIGGTAPPVAPSNRSLTGTPDVIRPAPRPPTAASRAPVVVRRQPPSAPVPFEAQRRALDTNPGRPPDARTLGDLRRQQPPPARPEYRPVPQQPNAPGQRRVETRQNRPAPQPGARETERRRRTIDQEHQRGQQPQRTERSRKK